jgi:N-acetylmuramic acid 6-phosphate etherase
MILAGLDAEKAAAKLQQHKGFIRAALNDK